ncbi:interferon lambda receptor 1 isoform X2 [Tenrec ecaudatus]|uniref:interferon lambda receptor 1 isoform X2 n=1 Tax=Tenrec ecaudatus TaxID=94439 RepID=UPI003F594A52
MAGAPPWAPLLLCLLQSAPNRGRPHLAAPQNVTLFSQNFDVYLKWLPGPGNPPDVTYLVAYQSETRPKLWRKVDSCAGTKELMCSLMCLKKQDLYFKFKGRVQATSRCGKSRWTESEFMNYLFDMEPAPPNLTFTHREGILSVNATYQLPQCMPSVDLRYEVYLWTEQTGDKTVLPITLHGQPVQIPIQPSASGHHCLSGRTIYTFATSKYSKFSEPTCFFLEAPGVNWPILMPLALLLPLLLVIAVAAIWRSSRGNPWFQQAKMPRALEPTRRVQLTPGVRTPAALQAETEKKSDEEEEDSDSDDNVSFQPYIKPPSFLGPGGQILRCPKAGAGGSGGLHTPVQVQGSSAGGSSGRSWASTLDSAFWDEAGSASWLANKEPGEEVDSIGPLELPPLPEFSEDPGSLKGPPCDDLSSWTPWESSQAELNLVPKDSPLSVQTLTFCWNSGPEEEEEEEEEDGEEWETEGSDSDSGSWGAGSCQRTEARAGLLGHYMAR